VLFTTSQLLTLLGLFALIIFVLATVAAANRAVPPGFGSAMGYAGTTCRGPAAQDPPAARRSLGPGAVEAGGRPPRGRSGRREAAADGVRRATGQPRQRSAAQTAAGELPDAPRVVPLAPTRCRAT
jgi:hypothetical protein